MTDIAPELQHALIEHLSGCVTERRLARMHDVLAQRTGWLTVVLEDIFQPHNASAVLRSCECFGVQGVHIVEDRNDYTVSCDVASVRPSGWIWTAGERQRGARSMPAAMIWSDAATVWWRPRHGRTRYASKISTSRPARWQ